MVLIFATNRLAIIEDWAIVEDVVLISLGQTTVGLVPPLEHDGCEVFLVLLRLAIT